MKFNITVPLFVLVLLVYSAHSIGASPLVIPLRQQQQQTCASLIRSNPLLQGFCKTYLGRYKPASTTVTATITSTSTPRPITVTVATSTATVTTTSTSTFTPSLFYPNNPPAQATLIDRSVDKIQIPPVLRPFAQVVFDACVDVLYPPPRPTGTTTVTSTVTTTLQALTASTTVTTTTTLTASTTVIADVAQTAVAPPPSAGKSAGFLRVEGQTQTLFEGFVSAKAENLPYLYETRCDSGVGTGANPISALVERGLDVGGALIDYHDGRYNDVNVDRIGPDHASAPAQWLGVKSLKASSAYVRCAAPLSPTTLQAQQEDLLALVTTQTGYLTASLAEPAKVYVAGQGTIRVQVNYSNGGEDAEVRPATGAIVGGVQAGGEGDAYIPVPRVPGQYAFKATRPDKIRSNSVLIYVKPAS